MQEEMFPGSLFVEAVARTDKHSQLMNTGAALVQLAQRLKP